MKIWTASQISEVMDQSHRIWRSNGSAAHGARFVEPPVRAGSIARLPPSQTGRPTSSGCFCSQITANAVIAKSEIQDFYRVRDPLGNPGEVPRRSSQSRRCHLFHLFYQVHIRLGSLHSSAGCFRHLPPNNSHRSSSSNRPAQPHRRFPEAP